MCGINGILGFNDKSLVRKMTEALKHRGPNSEGYFSDRNVELGHKRLSIIDLSGGKQPMHNEDGSICVVYNGEIYNYKELRSMLGKHKFATNSDTEVLVHLYEEFGVDFVKMLNGIFAFCIYDTKKKRAIIARDRAGTKPLYYHIGKNGLVFSSEIKSLLEYNEIKREIDFDSFKEYMQFGFVTAPNTVFKEIKKICPGEVIVWENGKSYRKRYWDFKFKEVGGSLDYYKNKFLNSFEDSVRGQLMSEVPLGAYLSGGLDSSSVVAMMRKLNPEGDIKTFSVGFESKEVVNELVFSRKVAKHFNTDNTEIHLDSKSIKELPRISYVLDEPINNLSAIPLYFMAKEASKKVRVVLTGNGGDELFGGYMQHRFMRFAIDNKKLFKASLPFAKISNSIYGTRKGIFLEKLGKNIGDNATAYKSLKYSEPDKEIFAEKLRGRVKEDESIARLISGKIGVNKLTLVELKKLLPENYLMVDDKINMNFSIESRVPFLDNKMISLSEELPEKFKAGLFEGKIIVREAMKNILPNEVIKRKKYGFTAPATLWFKENYSEIESALTASSPIYEYLDKNKVEEMLKRRKA